MRARRASTKRQSRRHAHRHDAHARPFHLRGRYLDAIFSIRAHSESVTGITDNREIRTSGKSANALSALISARVTGRGSFFTGATSTTDALPLLSFGSGYASPRAF